MWHVSHRRSPGRYAVSQAFPTSVPVMHGPVLPLLIIGLGLAGVVLARVLLLPFAKLLPTPSLARVFGVKSAGYANIGPLPR